MQFELRRSSDGLVYHFSAAQDAKGRRGFCRADGDYWIIFHPKWGWIAGDWEGDEVFGRPWMPPETPDPTKPPEGVWVSRKGDKSYVYDLVFV